MRIALVGLYSAKYPAIGETHALSVLAGVTREVVGPGLTELALLDMVALSEESVDRLLEFLKSARPDILGISVAYGTFSFLCNEYPKIRNAIGPKCWLVLGGAIATALPERILQLIDDAVIVMGEGEMAFSALLRQRMQMQTPDFAQVPGIAYRYAGEVAKTERVPTNLAEIAAPFRAHIPEIIASGGQIYTEASRGCSWAACRFCLRGLTDIRGSPREYRRFSQSRLHSDLQTLVALGVRHVTFADEDFFGGDYAHASWISQTLSEVSQRLSSPISFDVSVMPHSIFSKRIHVGEVQERRLLIAELKKAGLRKVFLGVESGSPGQLRRYAKGHSREEAGVAIATLRAEEVDIELGWIMFDPLCTRAELLENVEFLRDNDLIGSTSFLFAELRLQAGARYLALLDRQERETGAELYDRHIDPDTLSHVYDYQHADVGRIVREAQRWSQRIRPLHYPLKNLTRFQGSVLDQEISAGRRIVTDLRHGLFEAFSILVTADTTEDDVARSAWDAVENAAMEAADRVGKLVDRLNHHRQSQPTVNTLASTARAWRRADFTLHP